MIRKPQDVYGYLGVTFPDKNDFRDFVEAAAARQFAAGNTSAVFQEITTEVPCYVSNGTWVVDCECGAGAVAHPDWQRAGCVACGRWYTDIAYPDDWQDVETVLDDRKEQRHKNWQTTESCDDLRIENRRNRSGCNPERWLARGEADDLEE